MKRALSLLLVVGILFSIPIAYASDYSSMTDAQLKEQFNAIRNELTTRGLVAEKNTVILEQAGVKIYISGAPTITKSWSGSLYLHIPVIIINDSGKSIAVMITETSVNGWTAYGSLSGNVPIGKKAKTELEFNLEDTDIETIEDFTDAEFAFYVYDNDDWFGQKVVEQTEPITVYASQIK